MLTATVPLDLGRPRAGAKVGEVNAAIEASARRNGALVLDLRGFGARNLLMADHVHPTAFGQIAIAERALDVLAADGMEVRVRPSSLIHFETTRVGRCAVTSRTPTGTRRSVRALLPQLVWVDSHLPEPLRDVAVANHSAARNAGQPSTTTAPASAASLSVRMRIV